MRLARFILISVAVALMVMLIGVTIALNSSVQTWIVHRALGSHPELHLSIGRVTAGFHRVQLRDVTFERDGARAVLPLVDAELEVVSAGFEHRFAVSRLTARGWTLDLRPRVRPTTGAIVAPPVSNPHLAGGTPSAEPGNHALVGAQRFTGVFPTLRLPFDMSVRAVELEGMLLLPGGDDAARIRISGGNLGPTEIGKFNLSADATLSRKPVGRIMLAGVVQLGMDTPRTFSSAAMTFTTTASGAQLKAPVVLNGEISASRQDRSETYAVTISGSDRRLLTLRAEYPVPSGPISGSWAMDIRDSDVAPFSFGKALPTFTAVGHGKLESDATFASVHAVGSLNAGIAQLAALSPELADVGPIRMTADLDVAQRDGVLSVATLDAAFSAEGSAAAEAAAGSPLAKLHTLQPFEFNIRSGELKAGDAERDLLGIELQGVPLSWTKPFTGDVHLQGSDVRGVLAATPRAGGFRFRTKGPLVVPSLTVTRAGRRLVENIAFSLTTSGDYTPQGWQAELSGVTAKSGAATMLLIDAKAGRLAGPGQPVKATGLISVDLPALLSQPFARDVASVQHGDATIEFAASLGSTKEFQATISLKNLVTDSQLERLPSIAATVRADVEPGGRINLSAPVTIEKAGRTSDLAVVGAFSPTLGGPFTAQLTSRNFVFDDAKLLASLAKNGTGQKSETEGGAPEAPVWSRLNGTLAVQLHRFVYAGSFELNNVTGTVHLSGGSLKLENVRAGVGDTGGAQGDGTLSFDSHAAAPFSAGAHVVMADFDPGPLFVAASPGQPPTIEGKFTASGTLVARGTSLTALPVGAGRYELTSRGGVFRGLPVNVGNLVENSSKLASWLASAGSALSSLAGRKEVDEVPSRSKAASELARILSGIAYDQLNVVLSRDENLNTRFEQFSLISPEVRLSGSGRALHVRGKPVLEDPVSMEFHIRVRGRPAELMRYLGVLDPKVDDLGYAECTIPVRVEGTLARLDTTELSNRFVGLAVEKTGLGLTERAVDWFNRLRGRASN